MKYIISSVSKNFYSGIMLAVLTTLIWSGNYVIARGITQQVPPISLAFYRWLTASICITIIAYKKIKQEKHIVYENKLYILATALTGVTIFNSFIYLAGHYTSAINLALIGTTAAPIFASLLAFYFLKEKLGFYRITGMLICIMGIAYLLSRGSWYQLMGLTFGKGDILIVISAFSFAIYNTLVRKKPIQLSPTTFLFAIFTLGTLCLFPFYVYEIQVSPPVIFTGHIIAIILYLGIGNSVIAFFCWNASIKHLGASGTALFGNLIPVFSTIEAVFFLNESFTTVHLISGLFVIAGLVIANVKKNVS